MIVEAEIHLLSTEEGGRRSSLQFRWRPNHKLPGAYAGFYEGQVEFIDGAVSPGETARAKVMFVQREGLAVLDRGVTWDIYEGPRRVGWASVNKILER